MHFKHQRKFTLFWTELFIWVWHLKFVFNSADSVLRWWRWSRYVPYGAGHSPVERFWVEPCISMLWTLVTSFATCPSLLPCHCDNHQDQKWLGEERVYLACTSRSESIVDGSRGRGTREQEAWREVGVEGPGIRKPGGKSGRRDPGAGSLEGHEAEGPRSRKFGGMLFTLWLAQVGFLYSSDPPA